MKTRADQTQESASAQDDDAVNAVTAKGRSAKKPNALLAALGRAITRTVGTAEKTTAPEKAISKPNAEPKTALNQRNTDGQTPLAQALSAKDFEAAHKLIEAGADVNATDAIGFTALHLIVKMCEEYIAAGYSQDEMFGIITKLASKGIAFGRQDRRGNTPIMMVAQRATIRLSKGTAELYTNLGKLLLRLDKTASETVQLRNNMGKGALDYLAKVGNRPLWNAVHDKLPQAQSRMMDEALSKETDWKKLAGLGKELVG